MTDQTSPTHPDNPAVDAEFQGPKADARAVAVEAVLGTDAETVTDTIWLLRYTIAKHNTQLPTHEEIMRERHGCIALSHVVV